MLIVTCQLNSTSKNTKYKRSPNAAGSGKKFKLLLLAGSYFALSVLALCIRFIIFYTKSYKEKTLSSVYVIWFYLFDHMLPL